MESMYDKLGELLSKTLDSGFIPKKSEEKIKEKNFSQKDKIKEEEKIRPLPENVKSAFKKIKIPENCNFEEAKKIYREKLMHYHPDRRNENYVLQKVAKEKTEELLADWKIVENYFKSNFK